MHSTYCTECCSTTAKPQLGTALEHTLHDMIFIQRFRRSFPPSNSSMETPSICVWWPPFLFADPKSTFFFFSLQHINQRRHPDQKPLADPEVVAGNPLVEKVNKSPPIGGGCSSPKREFACFRLF
ncbi:hypothetical protein PpBr36_07534 [Pyricularia pennisetigena]|uniref:hypothetical protein n=1 Tax=Pyricularia pennisetigena TaxID=1578925 RepID=UPI0011537291|nr:hypothetical protein PpBr36_07534 [Pyricularia pennisetigena]TLS25121.1 hypothetical protein PpBr36_07534 [Pyricularia pennisetigena]